MKPGQPISPVHVTEPRSDQGYGHSVKILYRISGFLALITMALIILLYLVIKQGPSPDHYFAMTAEGRRMQLIALSEPAINTNAILQWTTQAAVQIMTFGFHDLNQRFADSKKFFTDKGWASFSEAMVNSGIFASVNKQQQIITAIPSGDPTVLYEGLREDGSYAWDIQVPLLLTARAGEHQRTARSTAIITVKKVPTKDNPNGLAIQKWFMT